MPTIILFLVLLGTALAVPRHTQKIVGGTPTEIQKYPFMTNLQTSWYGLLWEQAAGGALLTSTTILSAAHSFVIPFNDKPEEWRVRLGSSYASSGGDIHYVSQLIVHPDFDSSTQVADVAIVRLSSPAQYSESVQPCRIAGPTYILPDNTNVVNIGWGSLEFPSEAAGSFPEQLQEVTVQTVNQDVCAQQFAALSTNPIVGYFPPVTSEMLCSGVIYAGGKDACQGDDGSPLLHSNDIVIGVVSWGYQCAHPQYPSVNARVSHYSDWIAQNGAA